MDRNGTRIIQLKVEKLHKEADNRGTVVLPSYQPPDRSFKELFLAHYDEIRTLCEGFKRQGLAMLAMDRSGIAARACVASREERINSAVIGRHGMADVYLPGDASMSLRHMLVILHPASPGSEVRFRLMDLRTATAFTADGDLRLEALEAEGPVFVRCGSYTLFFFPTGDELPWADSAEAGWDCIPERIYLDQRSASPDRWRRREVRGQIARHQHDQQVSRSTRVRTIPGVRAAGMRLVDADEEPRGVLSVRSDAGACRVEVGARALGQGILLGRYDRCDGSGLGVFRDESISRVHVVLVEIADTVYAVDTASTNGVWSGDEEVRLTPLGEGDEFTLGDGLARLIWANKEWKTEDHD